MLLLVKCFDKKWLSCQGVAANQQLNDWKERTMSEFSKKSILTTLPVGAAPQHWYKYTTPEEKSFKSDILWKAIKGFY